MFAINLRRSFVALCGCSLLLLAGCKLGGGGLHYTSGEVETWLAVNPAALKQGKTELAGVWMADRWSNGGGSGLVAAASADGGRTWGAQDGGKSWSAPRTIFKAPKDVTPTGSVISVDPRNGTLYHIFRWAKSTGPGAHDNVSQIGLQRSQDGGQTWTEAKGVVDVVENMVKVPGTETEVRTGGPLPLTAVDSRTGRIYAVWGDARFRSDKQEDIALSYSDDQGDTWSQPVRVNPESSRGAFRGTVAVNARGQVAVSYYDFRELGESAAKWPAHLWLAVYTPTEAGLGAPKETHIAGPFDLAKAPMAPGPFLGDYLGLAGVNDGFTLFYVATTDQKDNPTDVFSVTVK